MLAEMRYRISFLALRRSAIKIMPYNIQRDQNWANSAGRYSWGGRGGGGGGGGGGQFYNGPGTISSMTKTC